MGVQTYQDLVVWQRAMDMVIEIYQMTQSFPKQEQYGLVSQMRRAAVSVASNIAEGQGRGFGQEFAHHLRMAQGSLQEMETQMILAQRLQYVPIDDCRKIMSTADEVGKLFRRLHQSVVCDRSHSKPATSNQ